MPAGASGGKSGHGISIAFGTTTGFSPKLHKVGGLEELRASLEDTYLGLAAGSYRTRVPADLVDLSEIEIEYEYDQSQSTPPPITADAETITFTWPLETGETTAATLAGSAFVTKRSTPEIAVVQNDVQIGKFSIQFDGKTGPTFTPGS